jgi:hypothetical protein
MPILDRASAHCFGSGCAPPAPEARFRDGVDDLAMATLLEILESGYRPVRSRAGRWTLPGEAHPFNLSTIIGEAIRTGLVINVPRDALIPAPVHLAVWDGECWHVACPEPGVGAGPKRVRMHSDPIHVDCLACLDRL